MFINYARTVDFSTVIVNAGLNEDGLITCCQKTTTGAPAATVGKYIPAAIVQNTFDATCYQNVGTTALPVWALIDTAGAGGITQLTGDVTAGPGSGSVPTTIANLAITNAKVAAAAAIAYSKLAALAPGAIVVGSALSVPTVRTVTGDMSLSNTGNALVDGINGFVVDTVGVINQAQDRIATVVPLGAPQALSGAGALALTSYQTRFTSTATGNALTLADGTMGGQTKKVTYVAEAAGGDTGVITAATGLFTTVTLNAVGDYAVFLWVSGVGWQCIDFVGATVV